MADICRFVRMALQGRLANSTYGLNATYAAIQTNYGVPDLAIDWTATSPNFAWGRIPPDLIEETSPFTYPLLTISAERGQMDQAPVRVRYQQFSGLVLAVVEVHLSWPDEHIVDFETWPDAVIQAMFDSLNDPTITNDWGPGLLYNGELSWQKGPIMLAGENWRRTISFPVTFRVIV